MIVLVGESASGKTEVAKMLAARFGIQKMITTTTRPMRSGEVDGKDYFFVSKDEFEKRLKDKVFVEHTFYNGNYYGSGRDQIADNRVIVVDPSGLASYIALGDKKIITFRLLADEDTRYERMINRGDPEEAAKARLITDRMEFSDGSVLRTDFVIDTEKYGIEGVAEVVHHLYIQELEKRKLLK